MNETERAVLGCVLNKPDLLYKARAMGLTERHFGTYSNRLTYNAMLELMKSGADVDLISVRDYLGAQKKIDAVGGTAYLAQLDYDLPDPSSFTTYVDAVRAGGLRRAVSEAGKLMMKLPEDVISPQELMGAVHDTLRDVNHLAEGHMRVTSGSDAIHALVEDLEEGTSDGISTGYHGLDQALSGIRPGNLILIAGRPGMGKTSLAMCMARNQMTQEEPITPCVFSLEMSSQELAMMLLSAESGIPRQKLKMGALGKEEWTKIVRSGKEIEKRPLVIEDSGSLTIDDLSAKARELRNTQSIDIIYIDYLQLMSGRRYSKNRTEEVSEISRGLKQLAKELEIPIIALSQLSRKNEERADRRPVLSDLRDSGSLEQDADAVIFLYRAGYYKIMAGKDDTTKGVTELNIAKNRSGPAGRSTVVWEPQTTTFRNP